MGRAAGTPQARRASRGRAKGAGRSGRQGWRRYLPPWKAVLALFALGVAVVVGGIAMAYARTDIPEPKADITAQTTVVYYADGTTELGRFAEVNREIVPAEAIPQHLRDAVVAAEDRTFYTNRGISPTGIARAAWNNLKGGSLQGGSTITQQYVKNSFLNSDRTWQRKAKEFFVSVKVARAEDKDAILTNYLNTIYFGRNSYGVQAASTVYFGKDVADISLSEAAFLAGIINGPELYDPADGQESLDKATTRWNYVLDGMVTMEKLPAADRQAQTFPVTVVPAAGNANGGQTGYLLRMVRAEVKTRAGFTDQDLDTGGLRIVSTFDKRLVEAGVAAVRDTLPEDTPSGVQVAMASIDPATGAVRAIFGGYDYLERQRNGATQDIAQAGSTFKPFTLVAALEGESHDGSDGISLKTRYDGRSPQEFDAYPKPVSNFGNTDYGKIDLVKATSSSVNTVYVALNEEIGPERTLDAAVRAGLPEDAIDLEANLGNVLGTASVHPIDMASAYATFAAQGVRHDRFVVQQISTPNGGTPYTHTPVPERVFDEQVVADATYAMQQVVRSGSGEYAKRLDRPVAGKTGTSQESRSAWFVGFTPQLSTAVAMYRISEDGTQALELPPFGEFRSITGGTFPVRIWTAYTASALEGAEEIAFPQRADVGVEPEPEPTVTQTPEPTPTPTPTVTQTQPVPSLTPTETTPGPSPTESSPEPEPSPSPSDTPSPDPSDDGRPTGRPTVPAPTVNP